MIYLATPYSNTDVAVRTQRWEAAIHVTGTLISVGHRHIFSPIVHCHPLSINFTLPYEFSFWEQYDTKMLKQAEMLLVVTSMEGWHASTGIAAEVALAVKLGVPIRYLWAEDLLLSKEEMATTRFHDTPPTS